MISQDLEDRLKRRLNSVSDIYVAPMTAKEKFDLARLGSHNPFPYLHNTAKRRYDIIRENGYLTRDPFKQKIARKLFNSDPENIFLPQSLQDFRAIRKRGAIQKNPFKEKYVKGLSNIADEMEETEESTKKEPKKIPISFLTNSPRDVFDLTKLFAIFFGYNIQASIDGFSNPKLKQDVIDFVDKYYDYYDNPNRKLSKEAEAKLKDDIEHISEEKKKLDGVEQTFLDLIFYAKEQETEKTREAERRKALRPVPLIRLKKDKDFDQPFKPSRKIRRRQELLDPPAIEYLPPVEGLDEDKGKKPEETIEPEEMVDKEGEERVAEERVDKEQEEIGSVDKNLKKDLRKFSQLDILEKTLYYLNETIKNDQERSSRSNQFNYAGSRFAKISPSDPAYHDFEQRVFATFMTNIFLPFHKDRLSDVIEEKLQSKTVKPNIDVLLESSIARSGKHLTKKYGEYLHPDGRIKEEVLSNPAMYNRLTGFIIPNMLKTVLPRNQDLPFDTDDMFTMINLDGSDTLYDFDGRILDMQTKKVPLSDVWFYINHDLKYFNELATKGVIPQHIPMKLATVKDFIQRESGGGGGENLNVLFDRMRDKEFARENFPTIAAFLSYLYSRF